MRKSVSEWKNVKKFFAYEKKRIRMEKCKKIRILLDYHTFV